MGRKGRSEGEWKKTRDKKLKVRVEGGNLKVGKAVGFSCMLVCVGFGKFLGGSLIVLLCGFRFFHSFLASFVSYGVLLGFML